MSLIITRQAFHCKQSHRFVECNNRLIGHADVLNLLLILKLWLQLMTASIGFHGAIKVTEVFEYISLPLARLILAKVSSRAAKPFSYPGKPLRYLF